MYEAVHRLRLDEIRAAVAACRGCPGWMPAGCSWPAAARARWPSRWRGTEFLGRLIYSWPCEDNYFVDRADNGFAPDCPILNILSGHDPYFSADSPLNRTCRCRATAAMRCATPPTPSCSSCRMRRTRFTTCRRRAHTRRFLRELLRDAAGGGLDDPAAHSKHRSAAGERVDARSRAKEVAHPGQSPRRGKRIAGWKRAARNKNRFKVSRARARQGENR